MVDKAIKCWLQQVKELKVKANLTLKRCETVLVISVYLTYKHKFGKH